MKNYILITGASSGIGLATARKLAENGENLILLARRIDRLEKIKKEIEDSFSVEVLIFSVDVCDQKQIENCFDSIKEKSISAVINNAGLARGRSSFQESNWSDLEEMIDTNVKGFTLVARHSMDVLQKTKGHLVNISSIAGREPYSGGHVYCGTKSFVKTFSKALRKDLLGTGVRVTDIAPAAVETEFSVVRFHGDKESAKAVYDSFDSLVAKDIADSIFFALQAPIHVNIEEMVVYSTDQASPTEVFRKN